LLREASAPKRKEGSNTETNSAKNFGVIPELQTSKSYFHRKQTGRYYKGGEHKKTHR